METLIAVVFVIVCVVALVGCGVLVFDVIQKDHDYRETH